MADGKSWSHRLGVVTVLTALSVVVLITLACGGGTTTAPAAPAPLAIAPAATPTTVGIASTVTATPLAIAPTAMPTPSAAVLIVEDFFEAFNQGNLGALKGVYSDTVILVLGSRFPDSELENTTGLVDVLDHDRESIDDHVQFTPSNLRVKGSTVTSQISYTDEELERDGLAPLSGSMSFNVERGKITAIVVGYDDESKQRFAKSIMGKRVPDFQMRLYDESIVSLDDLLADGRPVFLFFTAVW